MPGVSNIRKLNTVRFKTEKLCVTFSTKERERERLCIVLDLTVGLYQAELDSVDHLHTPMGEWWGPGLNLLHQHPY